MTNETTTEPRLCAHCSAPLPANANPQRKYCNHAHARMASYYRKTPEERAEINKRSNTRRFKNDLLPRIRLLANMPAEFTPGSEDAQFAVAVFLTMAQMDWRTQHALNFKTAREALAAMAGGYEALEEIEEQVFERAMVKIDRNIKEAVAAA